MLQLYPRSGNTGDIGKRLPLIGCDAYRLAPLNSRSVQSDIFVSRRNWYTACEPDASARRLSEETYTILALRQWPRRAAVNTVNEWWPALAPLP